MIIKSRYPLPTTTDEQLSAPVLPLMTGVLFPGMTFTVQIGRPENLALLHYCLKGKHQFVASHTHAEIETKDDLPLHQVGTLAKFRDVREGPSGTKLVTIEGEQRVVIDSLTARDPYLCGAIRLFSLSAHQAQTKAIKSRIEQVIGIVKEITHLDPAYSPELSRVLELNVEEPSVLADRIASTFHFTLGAKQELLEAIPLELRFDRLLHHLNLELNRIATVLSINDSVKRRIEDEQQKQFLRLQLNEIRRQLGDDLSEEREAARWRTHIKSLKNLPEEVRSRAQIEIDRLSQLSPASAEFGVTKSYLDWLTNLPWGKIGNSDVPIADAKKILEQEYYGPQSLRDQILQRLSVRKLTGGTDESPTLCLVGAPGTGKAALARSIARALGREFIRMSVGGIGEVGEIKGTGRTYLGSFPGRFVRALRECPTCDPVILIEDIDYFNLDNDSSLNMALLEVIDTRKNSRFLDKYLGVSLDLSKVFFICSVRAFEEIPEQFVPRLEIIELPGYIEREKIAIARKFIIPNLTAKHGLEKSDLRFSDEILSMIIGRYTQEAGLVQFAQQIEKICRRQALDKSDGKKRHTLLTEKDLPICLGTPPFQPEKPDGKPEVGTATGLAWTGSGGELMFIEGLKIKGDGQIITTGSLGEVMRESIQAAYSYVRAKSDDLDIDLAEFKESDVHIHFPSGAIPKDGPSAGITVSLVIASVMSGRPIRSDMAMTGEVTLRGKVLAVGGVKEKVSAAHRGGLTAVVLPKGNEKDLKDLPKEIIKGLTIHFIERVDELFELCLLEKPKSTKRTPFEKMLRNELKKISRTRGKARKSNGSGANERRSHVKQSNKRPVKRS